MKGYQIVLLVCVLCLILLLGYKYCYNQSNYENFAGKPGYYQIAWEEPDFNGGSPIDKYSISIKDGDDVVVQEFVTNPVYNFGKGDVDAGKWETDYDVSIKAINKQGLSSEPATMSFNSKMPTANFSKVSYMEIPDPTRPFNRVPITLDTSINSTFTIHFETDEPIIMTELTWGLRRGNELVCNSSLTGNINDKAKTEFDYSVGLNCNQGVDKFLKGDIFFFGITYEDSKGDSADWYKYTDPGLTISYDNPSPVKNISVKYISE